MSFGVGAAAPDSLSLAVAFHQTPARFPELLRGHGALPSGIAILLRLAGGASLDDEEFEAPPLLSVAEMRTVARFFVEQVLLARDADHYRILGVSPDASLEEIKEHHRLLMRMFHPDRVEHVSDANAAIAARINLAYNSLRLPADRAAYDAKLRQATKAPAFVHAPPVRTWPLARAPEPRKPVLPPFVARHLPQFVLGGVAIVASLGVGIMYVTREPAGAIGAGEGRIEQLDSPAHIAMNARPASPSSNERPASPSSEVPVAEGSSPASAPGNVQADAPRIPAAEVKPREAVPEQPPRRHAIEAARDSVQSSPVVGERREVASLEEAPPSLAERTMKRPPAPLQPKEVEHVAPATPLESKASPALQMAIQLPAPATNAPTPAPPVGAPAPLPVPQPAAAPNAQSVVAAANATASAPVVVAAAPPRSTPPSAQQIAEPDLVSLVDRLSSLYAKGDLEQFLALFSDDARIEHGGKDRIRADYADLFRSTDARQLNLSNFSWKSEGGVYRGQGVYEAKVVRKGEDQAHVYDGIIRLEVVQVNGAPRVRAMFH